ncbi:ribbon-helix-helix protein, CopG family [Geobacter sp.]|uniref:ribbon-helix-helix protein, CopG family n=1 Tax=Geobacter sp. TaxID=46610 RepID=UPI0026235785|nr:ribbon-helix-helix protein, CopG family [Geobacter sp.]
MQHRQKQSCVVPKKKQRRRDETALTNVVSLRVSDQEKRALERITKSSSRSVSEVVREAIEFWLTKRKGFVLSLEKDLQGKPTDCQCKPNRIINQGAPI